MAESKVGLDKDRLDVLRQGNISLILDSYDDLFSDFDPRPYSEKALSDDFLNECRKASVDKAYDGLELRLLVPKHRRNARHEAQIRKRLKDHFQKHAEEKEREQKRIRREGCLWSFTGACMIFVATLLYSEKGFFYSFLLVVFEPAGWFTVWSGLDKIFSEVKEKQPLLEFYKKMLASRINFYSC
jgi:hypothetical protein